LHDITARELQGLSLHTRDQGLARNTHIQLPRSRCHASKSTDHFDILSHAERSPTTQKVDHKLSDILVIALCGTICGVDIWADLECFADAKAEPE